MDLQEKKKELLNKYNTNTSFDLEDAVDMIRVLRGKDGCPWDAEQTHGSIRNNLVEEAYEVLHAIETNDIPSLYDELGDVLMQVIFHALIGEDEGEFDLNDVCTAMCEKMIRRHPHVFADVQADTSSKVLQNWESIKKKEKGLRSGTESVLDVPVTLPALTRAYKIQQKAAGVGFDWDDPQCVIDKVAEELSETREAYEEYTAAFGADSDVQCDDKKDGKDMLKEHLREEIGDLMFSAVNLSL